MLTPLYHRAAEKTRVIFRLRRSDIIADAIVILKPYGFSDIRLVPSGIRYASFMANKITRKPQAFISLSRKRQYHSDEVGISLLFSLPICVIMELTKKPSSEMPSASGCGGTRSVTEGARVTLKFCCVLLSRILPHPTSSGAPLGGSLRMRTTLGVWACPKPAPFATL